MSVINIRFRVDAICKKYDRYDVENHRDANASSEDPFVRLYSAVESEIDAATTKAEAASMETNRATAVAMNTEIRRAKARMMDEVPKLQKLARKKVKGLTKEEVDTRYELILVLPERIQAIPDATTAAPKPNGGWGTSASRRNIKMDSDGQFGDSYFQQSEESSQFRKEYEMRKMKQDQGLDVISEGLDTLKELAHDMNEEIDRQVPLMDEMDAKVNIATNELKNTNVRLKENLFKMRSSRNFCIDIILLCVLLGIASYIYNVLKN